MSLKGIFVTYFSFTWPWLSTSWPPSWSFHTFADGSLVPICIKIGSFVFKTNLVTDERMDTWMDKWTTWEHSTSTCQYGRPEALKLSLNLSQQSSARRVLITLPLVLQTITIAQMLSI